MTTVEDFVRGIINPFQTPGDLKILDGSTNFSSGVEFRGSGTVTLPTNGNSSLFVLFPGYGQTFCYELDHDMNATTTIASGAQVTMPPNYPSHWDTMENIYNLRMVRVVGAAVKLTLLNNADDNEGIWEAIRLPVSGVMPLPGTDVNVNPRFAPDFTPTELGNYADYPTYASGLLRDIDRFLFRLNSTSATHPFTKLNRGPRSSPTSGIMGPSNGGWNQGGYSLNQTESFGDVSVDWSWDVIVIKVKGRSGSATPSQLLYETISCQEVVYKPSSIMARLASRSPSLGKMAKVLEDTQIEKAAIQVK